MRLDSMCLKDGQKERERMRSFGLGLDVGDVKLDRVEWTAGGIN